MTPSKTAHKSLPSQFPDSVPKCVADSIAETPFPEPMAKHPYPVDENGGDGSFPSSIFLIFCFYKSHFILPFQAILPLTIVWLKRLGCTTPQRPWYGGGGECRKPYQYLRYYSKMSYYSPQIIHLFLSIWYFIKGYLVNGTFISIISGPLFIFYC